MKGRRGWNGEPRESIVQSGGISDDMYWLSRGLKECYTREQMTK